jgi:hypothetical protein
MTPLSNSFFRLTSFVYLGSSPVDGASEQDRARQFVAECCILDEHTWSAFTGGFGLYPAYKSWCQVSGYSALGKGRFIQELERVVPCFRKAENKRMEDGVRRTLNGAYGLYVDPNGGGEVIKHSAEINPALLDPLTPDNSDLVGVIPVSTGVISGADIVALTGYLRASAQVRWLRGHGWRFSVNALGRPVIATAEWSRKMIGGSATQQQEPNWGALNGPQVTTR